MKKASQETPPLSNALPCSCRLTRKFICPAWGRSEPIIMASLRPYIDTYACTKRERERESDLFKRETEHLCLRPDCRVSPQDDKRDEKQDPE